MTDDNRTVLYLNIVILDASETIRDKVNQKVEKSKIPEPLKGTVAKHASNAAASKVTSAMVAEKMGRKMCKKMPQKMAEKGLTVVMEESFREGPYVVLQMQVIHVDTIALTKIQKANAATEAANSDKDGDPLATTIVQWCWNLIGSNYQEKLETGLISNAVQKNLANQLSFMLAQKMEAKKMQAETEIVSEEKQARYFYARLKQMRVEEEAKKGKNPMEEFKKMLPPPPGRKNSKDSDSDSDDDDF